MCTRPVAAARRPLRRARTAQRAARGRGVRGRRGARRVKRTPARQRGRGRISPRPSAHMLEASQPSLFIFGYGYVAKAVADLAFKEGYAISATVRDAKLIEPFCRERVSAHLFIDTGLSASGLRALEGSTHVLATAPPSSGGDALLRWHKAHILKAACKESLHWAGFLSTTSVYGDHAGCWVNEQSHTRVSSESKASLRLSAEQQWLSLRDSTGGQLRSHVFRLAGIYGPGRSALDTVRRLAEAAAAEEADSPDAASIVAAEAEGPGSPPLEASAPKYVSRIHVDDIARALLASMQAPAESSDAAVYNVADDEPAPRAEVLAFSAELLGMPPSLAWSKAAQGSGTRASRRQRENKRVDNSWIKTSLLTQGLAYPTYKEGLRAIKQRVS